MRVRVPAAERHRRPTTTPITPALREKAREPENEFKNREVMFIPCAIGPGQLVIIILVIILLFGAKRIPELMRGLGRGVKEF